MFSNQATAATSDQSEYRERVFKIQQFLLVFSTVSVQYFDFVKTFVRTGIINKRKDQECLNIIEAEVGF